MSAHGTGHLYQNGMDQAHVRAEMEVPGVARVKRLGIPLTGLTVEKDAPFQVGFNCKLRKKCPTISI